MPRLGKIPGGLRRLSQTNKLVRLRGAHIVQLVDAESGIACDKKMEVPENLVRRLIHRWIEEGTTELELLETKWQQMNAIQSM